MTKTTVFLIVDAGRADYVRPETMPFLDGLAQGSLRGSFVSPPGFAQRTTFFTGRYPDTSGNLSAYVYDPEASPFAWLRRFAPLASLVRPYRAFFPARMLIKAITQRVSGSFHADPAWIPPKYAPFFRPCEDMRPVHEPGALGAESVFDLARRHGREFSYRAHPLSGDDGQVHTTLVRGLRQGKPIDLHVAQLSILDEEAHRHGPESDRVQRHCLRELDGRLASIHAALTASYDSWDLFVCADHGMAPVRQRVNVLDRLRGLPVVPAQDYVVFVNSTLAAFWYLTRKAADVIDPVLATIPGASVLDEHDRAALRIPTDERWGHRMLAADPGALFWPDYFHVVDSTIRGMHGYVDKREEQHGMAVIASNEGHRRKGTFAPRPLVDVFPTLCDLVGVPTPPGQEGTSLFAGE